MEDFDRRRPYTSEALIAALEAANLPPLPDDWRKMIAEGSPLWGPIIYALIEEFENPGSERSTNSPMKLAPLLSDCGGTSLS
jgi:hypothetical protein